MKLFMKRHIRKTIRIAINLDMRILSLAILLMALNCKSQKELVSGSPEDPIDRTNLTLMLTDNYGGTEEQEIRVVRDQQQLREFFSEINRTRKPGLPVPEIDFTRQMVIIYSSGQLQGSSGRPLVVSQQTEDTLMLRPEEPTGKSQADGTATIQPFSLYTIPLTDKKILLADQK